ncbi:MAG TPA: thermonuclease family protein, partial [Vulgatibacter sp.]
MHPPFCASVLLFLALILGGCTSSTSASDGMLRGRVVALSDGDTITVLDAGKTQHKIRLTGIDAPERRQPFGTRSTEHLSGLVFQKEVEVEWTKRDRWGRILGKVLVAEPGCEGQACPKIDANLAQISAGMAWWYRQYARDQPSTDRLAYEQAEA